MEYGAKELADRLERLFDQEGLIFSQSADASMPFVRPSPQQALRDGLELRYAAVALPLFRKNNVWHLALMQRTEYPGVHSGQISIPGGEVELGDAHRKETALREFAEEMGVKLPPDMTIAGLSERFIPPSRFVVTPFISVLEEEPKWNVDDKEVESVLVLPVQSLLHADALRSTSIELSDGIRASLPAYHWEGHVIWGATAIILAEFGAAWKRLVELS